MEAVEGIKQGGIKRKSPKRSRNYSADFKLQVVKKYLEEGIPVKIIRQECGVGIGSVMRWVRAYRRYGEAGLTTSYSGEGRSLPAPDIRLS